MKTEETLNTHDCIKCSQLYRSSHQHYHEGICPRCLVRELAELCQPSELVMALANQIDAIVEDADWRRKDVMQLSIWLKDARRIEEGRSPS